MHSISEVFGPLNTQQLVHTLLYGECRGESLTGQVAVACVVRNRAELLPRLSSGRTGSRDLLDYRRVILTWAQFSCMWPQLGGDNYKAVTDFVPHVLAGGPFSRVERQLAWVATGTMSEDLIDPTSGATHYYAPAGLEEAPHWTLGAVLTATIGKHLFFKNVA